MGLSFITTGALIVMLVLWSLGWKAIDGLLISVVIMLVAATVKMLMPFLPGNRPD
jgi:hypothetical protein